MRGYFVLGSRVRPPDLDPMFSAPSSGSDDGTQRFGAEGNHTGSPTRGYWCVSDCLYLPHTVNIPTRDKQVVLWTSDPEYANDLCSLISVLDSEEGINYRDKLSTLRRKFDDDFKCVINNVSVSTHGSLAVLGEFYYYGLHDPSTDTSYLMWTTDPDDVLRIQQRQPRRYLIFRFPQMNVVFLSGELLCAKWWRWTKNGALLQAFNALEMRLNNGSLS